MDVKTSAIRFTNGAEHSLAIGVLALMAFLPIAEIAGRQFLGRGVPGSIVLVQHLTLWITFLGAALAARSGRLLTMSTPNFLSERIRAWTQVCTSGIAAGIVASLAVASLEIIRVDRESGARVAWGIPVWAAVAIVPIAFALIAARLIWSASPRMVGRGLAALGFVIPAIVGLTPVFSDSMLLLPALGLIVIATALGLPIFAAIGGAAILLFAAEGIGPISVSEEAYQLSTSEGLPVIPLYTLAGYLLAEGGAGQRLLRVFKALVGWMPGSLAIVTTLLLAFFTPLTGASGVTILSLGGLLLPLMTKAGYPEKTSIGLVTVAGSIGLLFPPSTPVILFGIYAHTPIDKLFIAGLIPGILLMTVVALWGARRGWLAGAMVQPFSLAETGAAVWKAKFDLLLPVVVIWGIFGGVITAVEAAAVTVLYAFVIECIIHRTLGFKRDLPRIGVECSTLVGGFLIILAVALGFTSYLEYADVPTQVLGWVRAHVESPQVFLLALNVFLIIVGALMDIYSAILIVVPLIVPVAAAYAIDPIHLGVIFLANMELGYLMPPMGENLFLSSYRFNQPLSRIYASTLPYILMLVAVVLLITYVPWLTTALPAWLEQWGNR
jgi:tripartite ATP-independent transporter DctM subunit